MRIYADNGHSLCSTLQQPVPVFSSVSTQYGALFIFHPDLKTHHRFLSKLRNFGFICHYITGSQSLKQVPIDEDIQYCSRPSFVRLRQRTNIYVATRISETWNCASCPQLHGFSNLPSAQCYAGVLQTPTYPCAPQGLTYHHLQQTHPSLEFTKDINQPASCD